MPASKSGIVGNTPKDMIARQDAFLKAFAELGTISHSANTVGINRRTVQNWLSADSEGFRERWVEANLNWRDNLEHHAWERVKQQKPESNPALLITMLNGNLPDKYRQLSSNGSDEQVETLGLLRQAAQQQANNRNAEEVAVKTIEQVAEDTLQEKRNDNTGSAKT